MAKNSFLALYKGVKQGHLFCLEYILIVDTDAGFWY